MGMTPDNQPPSATMGTGPLKITSDEINILIYLYLLESNFAHTAFTLLSESELSSSQLFHRFNSCYPTPSSATGRSATSLSRTNGTPKALGSIPEGFGASNGKIAKGELIRKLWKALRWEEIEHHAANQSADVAPSACQSPFHLLVPHVCSREGSVHDDLAASPPPKRPEAFPLPHRSGQFMRGAESIASDRPSSRDRDTPPLVLGKGKRKGFADSPPSSSKASSSRENRTSAMMRTPEPSILANSAQDEALSDRGPASKRARDDKLSASDYSRAKQGASRSHGENKLKASKMSQQADRGGGGSWNEHRDAVNCVAWNPKDKEVLVTGSSDGTARLWHFAETDTTNHVLQLVKKPSVISHKSIDTGKKAVTALVWHPDGTVFATASDGVGRLFTPSGQLQGILTSGRGVINSLKFNPSGTSLLAAKDDFTVCLYVLDFNLQSPKQVSFEAHSNEVNDVDWLDDDVFASGGNDHTIFICRANDRRPRFVFKGHTDDITRVLWSPSETDTNSQQRLLASVSDDGTIMIWRLPHYPADRGTVSRSMSPSKQPREKEQSSEDFPQVVVAPGSEYCVNRLVVVDGGTENKRMNTLAWSPICKDGRMIVAAGGQDSTVKLFDALSGECLHVLPGLESGTGSIAFSPFGSDMRPSGLVAGGGWNGKVIVWDVATGQSVHEYEIAEDLERQSTRDKPMMLSMAWRNDGQQLALGLHNKSLLTLYVGGLL